MSRGLDVDSLAEAQASINAPINLVKLELDSGNILVHSRLGDIVFDGATYTGIGQLGIIEGIEENSELSRSAVRLTLTGIEAALVSVVLGEYYQGRRATIYSGFVDVESGALIGTPAMMFRGKVDTAPIKLTGATASITLSVENELADWDKPRIRRYNEADQKARFPSDNFFKFAEQATDKQLVWGRASA